LEESLISRKIAKRDSQIIAQPLRTLRHLMPSFDIVSEVDKQEVDNALNQARKEVANRFDFKGVISSDDLMHEALTKQTEEESYVRQGYPWNY